MSDFNVTILGCGSAVPSMRHNPSSQVVRYGRNLFMIDCGEGTQLQLRRMKVSMSHLHHIFISHLHGDHFLGLPGLLSTLSLQDMTGEVHVYCFAQGIDLLRRILDVTSHGLSYQLILHPLDPDGGETVYEDSALTITTFRLYHYVDAVGFRFQEKPRQRTIRGDMVEFHQVPYYLRPRIKAGEDYVKEDGTVVPNSALTLDPPPSRSYAYCSDTLRDTRVADAVRGVTTLYHEATYGDDKQSSARSRGHSTAREAAEIARMADAGKLIIGHYSQTYTDTTPLVEQAREIFPNTIAADEGLSIDI